MFCQTSFETAAGAGGLHGNTRNVARRTIAGLLFGLEYLVDDRRRVKMTRLRMRVADRLKGAQNTYAMLSTFNEVDMTGLMQLRADYKVRSRPP